jgi:hypothetical protein
MPPPTTHLIVRVPNGVVVETELVDMGEEQPVPGPVSVNVVEDPRDQARSRVFRWNAAGCIGTINALCPVR